MQFGPEEGGEELPVLEYQLQQWRLFPYLAGAYVMTHFGRTFLADFNSMQKGLLKKADPDRLVRTTYRPYLVVPSFTIVFLVSRRRWEPRCTPYPLRPNRSRVGWRATAFRFEIGPS